MLDALTRTAFEAVCGLHLRILHDDLSVEWSPLLRLPCHSVLRQFHLAHIGGPVVLRISPLGRADHGSDSAGSLPLLLLRQLDDPRLLIFLQLGVDLSDTLISNSK